MEESTPPAERTDSEAPARDDPCPVSNARRLVAFGIDAVLVFVVYEMTASLLIAGVIFGLYATISLAATGRTLGKALLGLRVQGASGSNLSGPVAFLRSTVGYLASSLLGLGFLNIFIDPQRRGWHDLLFRSQVTQEPGQVSANFLTRQLDRWSRQMDHWRERQQAIFDRLSVLWKLVTACTKLLTRSLGSVERVFGALAGALGITLSAGTIATAPAAMNVVRVGVMF